MPALQLLSSRCGVPSLLRITRLRFDKLLPSWSQAFLIAILAAYLHSNSHCTYSTRLLLHRRALWCNTPQVYCIAVLVPSLLHLLWSLPMHRRSNPSGRRCPDLDPMHCTWGGRVWGMMVVSILASGCLCQSRQYPSLAMLASIALDLHFSSLFPQLKSPVVDLFRISLTRDIKTAYPAFLLVNRLWQ